MATMRRSASSNGPGIGARPSAASPRSGRGMRLSVAAIFTARRVLLRLLMEQRDPQWGAFYRNRRFRRGAPRGRFVVSDTAACAEPRTVEEVVLAAQTVPPGSP